MVKLMAVLLLLCKYALTIFVIETIFRLLCLKRRNVGRLFNYSYIFLKLGLSLPFIRFYKMELEHGFSSYLLAEDVPLAGTSCSSRL